VPEGSGGVHSLDRNRIYSFSLFNREFTGKIFIFGSKIEFARPQSHENTELYTKFPKKLTGNFISITEKYISLAGNNAHLNRIRQFPQST